MTHQPPCLLDTIPLPLLYYILLLIGIKIHLIDIWAGMTQKIFSISLRKTWGCFYTLTPVKVEWFNLMNSPTLVSYKDWIPDVPYSAGEATIWAITWIDRKNSAFIMSAWGAEGGVEGTNGTPQKFVTCLLDWVWIPWEKSVPST